MKKGEFAKHVVLLACCVVFVGPFVWISSTAFKSQISILTGSILFTPTLDPMREVLFGTTSNFIRTFGNSVIVATFSSLTVLAVALLAAYALVLQRTKWWVSLVLLGWATLFQMIPPITIADSWYTIFRSIGLTGSPLGLILAHTTLNLPMGLWLLHTFMKEVPAELVEAARVDGASETTILYRIVLPVVKPGVAATGILCFIFSWNEFAAALVLTDNLTATVPVGMGKFAQDAEVLYGPMAATAFLSLVPALITLMFGQRAIVKGLVAGAVK
jgi:multiple sugar transport system permease protein